MLQVLSTRKVDYQIRTVKATAETPAAELMWVAEHPKRLETARLYNRYKVEEHTGPFYIGVPLMLDKISNNRAL